MPLSLVLWVGVNTTALLHVALILGKDSTGNVVVWEKAGYSRPYRLTTLKKVFDLYGPGLQWGYGRFVYHRQRWLEFGR